MTPLKNCIIIKNGGQISFKLPKNRNAGDIDTLKDRINSFMGNGRKKEVEIDLCDIHFLYSILISLIVQVRNTAVERKGSVKLVNASMKCQEQLMAVNLDKICKIANKSGKKLNP